MTLNYVPHVTFFYKLIDIPFLYFSLSGDLHKSFRKAGRILSIMDTYAEHNSCDLCFLLWGLITMDLSKTYMPWSYYASFFSENTWKFLSDQSNTEEIQENFKTFTFYICNNILWWSFTLEAFIFYSLFIQRTGRTLNRLWLLNRFKIWFTPITIFYRRTIQVHKFDFLSKKGIQEGSLTYQFIWKSTFSMELTKGRKGASPPPLERLT